MSLYTIRGVALPACRLDVLERERDETAATVERLQARLQALKDEISRRRHEHRT